MRIGALPTTQLLFDIEVQPTPPSNSAKYAAAEASLKPGKTGEKPKPNKGTPYDVVFRFDPTQIAFAEGLTADAPPASNSTSAPMISTPNSSSPAAR